MTADIQSFANKLWKVYRSTNQTFWNSRDSQENRENHITVFTLTLYQQFPYSH